MLYEEEAVSVNPLDLFVMHISKKRVVLLLVFSASLVLAYHWSQEAQVPMTAERLRRLCNDQPECYPEWGYICGSFLALCTALVCVLSSLGGDSGGCRAVP